MKKILSLTAIALIGVVILTGCVDTKDKIPTPKATITNPISNEVSELGIATFSNGVTVKVSQLGVGYAVKDQTELWGSMTEVPTPPAVEAIPEPESTEIPEALPVEGTPPITTGANLIPNTKVVAVMYEVTNTSSIPVDVKNFSSRNGYYEPLAIEGGNALYQASDFSLHEVLGVPSYPVAFDEENEVWNLNTGETATWALDWQIVDADLNKESVILSQNFSLNSLWSSDNKFELNLKKPKSN